MQTRLRHIWLGSCVGLLTGEAGTFLVVWYLLFIIRVISDDIFTLRDV